jgi:coenzyme F420 hydrogenase subunit beta
MNLPINFFQEIELIKNNYCIGCGVCSVIDGFKVEFDAYGKYQVNFNDVYESQCKDVLKICPFAFNQLSEDNISSSFFHKTELKDPFLGCYLNNYIGHVTNEKQRLNSGSGGIITWLLLTLLREQQITDAVFVTKSKSKNTLFEYKISSKTEDIEKGASSKYYPIELSNVLNQIKSNDGSYAIVALPCFTKSIRLLQMQYPIFKKRIKFIISLVCGHLKSKQYAECLAWQKNINYDQLIGINFRKKLSSETASQYGTEFTSKNEFGITNTDVVKTNAIEWGPNWGHGLFKYPVCDYCDDIFGENADISVGDAWLKEYIQDYKGNSIVTTRNIVIDKILKNGIKKNELHIKRVDTQPIVQSQKGGISNKRDDLEYRLYLKKKNQECYPNKRVKPSFSKVSKKRREIIKQRLKISQLSHKTYKMSVDNNNFSLFTATLNPEIERYNNLYATPLEKAKKIIKKCLKKIRVIK